MTSTETRSVRWEETESLEKTRNSFYDDEGKTSVKILVHSHTDTSLKQ